MPLVCGDVMVERVCGRVCQGGMGERHGGRSKEGCAAVVSEGEWNGVTDSAWEGSTTIWVKGKVGLVKSAWVCMYAPVYVGSIKGLEGQGSFFREEGNACLKSFERERKCIVMGDLDAEEEDECVMDVVGK